MSRSYRIRVRDSLSRVLRAEDHVSTQLELLEILPCEQMAGLLADELEKRGFHREGELLVRGQNDVKVEICPADGTVTVSALGEEAAELAAEKEGLAWDDVGPGADAMRERLQAALQKELEQAAKTKTAALRGKVADRLEGQLNDLRQELDQAINRTTAAALKIKAKQIGTIKQLSEDPQSGSLTIVLEV